MVLIVYALIWVLAAASAGLIYFTGKFSEPTMTVFGFIFSTLVFMGMIAVLPWWVDKKYSWNYQTR